MAKRWISGVGIELTWIPAIAGTKKAFRLGEPDYTAKRRPCAPL